MKALVITNCATAAYTSGLRALFPDWEVKGANLDVARKWLTEEPNEAFRGFLCESELLLLGSENESALAEFASGKEVLSVPYFYFRGYHPDSFHLGIGETTVPSVLQSGNLHSRLAVAAFVLGLSQEETVAAFDADIYESIGYFSIFDAEKQELLERFAAQGIDLDAAFHRWRSAGNFLYTHNHARAFVFNDILLEALSGRFLDESWRESALEKLSAVPDYLEPSIRWPVYPEIAARYGLQSDFLWRTGVAAGPAAMTLADFVARTFEVLRSCSGLNADCVPGFARCRDALLDRESRRALKAAP
jgi:hypothetical protein